MPLSVEDKFEIHELLARYGHAIDAGDGEGLAGTFTDTGIFDGPGGRHEGTAALRQMAIDYQAHPDINNTQHWVNSIVVDGDGDSASVISYAMCVSPTVDGEAIRVELINKYNDEVRKINGRWLFQNRVVADVFPESINDFSMD